MLQLELRAQRPGGASRCGVAALLDVVDRTTGATTAQRHTPFFNGYRPQFYFR